MGISELLSTYGGDYLSALVTTWWMTAVSFAFVMVLSVAITVMRVSPLKPLRLAGDFYVQVFRNIPGVALLVIVVYALPNLRVVLDYTTCVIVTTVLMASAFGSENFMSGINTIGVGQIEAARSLGLTFTQSLREVILPQAFRGSIAPLGSVLIALTKNTTVASIIGVAEASGLMKEIIENETASFGVFFIFALGFVILTLPVGILFTSLSRRLAVKR